MAAPAGDPGGTRGSGKESILESVDVAVPTTGVFSAIATFKILDEIYWRTRADNLLPYMGRASTDPQGTQTIATSLGITRRAVQKRLKRTREADQSQPALPTLEAHTAPFTLLPTIAPMKNPPQACRILWSEAAGRASATEKMVSRRLREALVAGDMPTARLMAGALREIVMTIARLEEEAIRWNHGQKWLNDVPLKTIYSEDKY